MRITRFVNAFVGEEFLWIFILFIGGITGMITMFLAGRKYGSGVALFPYVGAFLFLIIFGVSSKLVDCWATRVFRRKFGFKPSFYNETKVMQKLKELAIEMNNRLKYEQARKKKKNIKKKFWSMCRLAKAFGFPVFKSWKTHAYSKFHF